MWCLKKWNYTSVPQGSRKNHNHAYIKPLTTVQHPHVLFVKIDQSFDFSLRGNVTIVTWIRLEHSEERCELKLAESSNAFLYIKASGYMIDIWIKMFLLSFNSSEKCHLSEYTLKWYGGLFDKSHQHTSKLSRLSKKLKIWVSCEQSQHFVPFFYLIL